MDFQFAVKQKYHSAFIAAAAILWAFGALLRTNLTSFPVVYLIAIENLIAAIPLLFFLYRQRESFMASSVKAKISLITTIILSGLLGNFFYISALQEVLGSPKSPLAITAIIQLLQPAVVLFLAKIVLKEKITPKLITWGGLALTGAFLMAFPAFTTGLVGASTNASLIAVLFSLLAVVAFGASTVFGRAAAKEIDYRFISAAKLSVTSAAAFAICYGFAVMVPLASISVTNWLFIAASAALAGGIATVFYYKGLSSAPAKIATFLELFWPLAVFGLDFIRGVEFSNWQVLGAIIVMMMVYRINKLALGKTKLLSK